MRTVLRLLYMQVPLHMLLQHNTNYTGSQHHTYDKDIAGTLANLAPEVDAWYCAPLDTPKVEIPILLFHNKLITCLTCKGLTSFKNDLVFEVAVNSIW